MKLKIVLFTLFIVVLFNLLACTPKQATATESPILDSLKTLGFKLQTGTCKSFFPNTTCVMYELKNGNKVSQRVYINNDGSYVFFLYFNPSDPQILDQIAIRNKILSDLYSKPVLDKIAELTASNCPPKADRSCYTHGEVDDYYIDFRLDIPYPFDFNDVVPVGWKPSFGYYEIYVGPKGEGCKWCDLSLTNF